MCDRICSSLQLAHPVWYYRSSGWWKDRACVHLCELAHSHVVAVMVHGRIGGHYKDPLTAVVEISKLIEIARSIRIPMGDREKLQLTLSSAMVQPFCSGFDVFKTHCGRVTHICVGKQTIIGSDNGWSPERRQAIIGTNAVILLIGP